MASARLEKQQEKQHNNFYEALDKMEKLCVGQAYPVQIGCD